MARAARPPSIHRFERLFYLGLAAAALNAWARATYADARTYSSEPGYILLDLVISTALNLLFLWLIAYRGSNIARWIFIGLVALAMISTVAGLPHALDDGNLSLALTLIQNLLCAIEIWLLLRSDSRDWFAGVRPVDPEIFR
jgi:hypothetical protein